jgi:hypothetical protein
VSPGDRSRAHGRQLPLQTCACQPTINFQPFFAGRAEPSTLQNIRNVDQLLTLDDLPFVEALYGRLLRRKATPEELEFYVGQLRSGYGKAELMVDFAALPEVIAKGLPLSGLQQYVAKRLKDRKSIWRFIGRARQQDSQLNRLENSLGRVLHEVDVMRQAARQRFAALESQLNLATADSPSQTASGPTAPPEEVDLSGVSVAVRRIFREVSREVESASHRDPL